MFAVLAAVDVLVVDAFFATGLRAGAFLTVVLAGVFLAALVVDAEVDELLDAGLEATVFAGAGLAGAFLTPGLALSEGSVGFAFATGFGFAGVDVAAFTAADTEVGLELLLSVVAMIDPF